MPELKTRIMDEDGVRRALVRIAHEIVEKNHGVEDVCLVGIRRRGVPIAESLRDNIEKIEGRRVPAGSLDITYYRDDLTRIDEMPRLQKSDLPFSIERKRVVLVDDVLYTGRTVRAAIETVFTSGRPKAIQLAVLIDRGHRELPIRADYVGKNIPTSKSELVEVRLADYDDETGVFLMEM